MGFLVLLAAFFVFRRMMWRHSGWHPRYLHRHYGSHGLWRMEYRPVELQRVARPVLSAKELREREMHEVKRRYVSDEIDVEEYERELDRILRKH